MPKAFFERFFFHVRKRPFDISLTDEFCSYTWKEYENLSGKVYAFLKDRGLGRADFVGIQMKRSAAQLICEWGVLRNGSAFVSLDSDAIADERADAIRMDCGCKFVIDETVWNEICSYRHEESYNQEISPHDAAFAIYTSGSTGCPKGALHEYGIFNEYCKDKGDAENFIFEEKNVFAIYTPLNMAGTTMFYNRALYAGCTSHVVPLKVISDEFLLKEFFERKKISVSFLPTSIASAFSHGEYPQKILVGGESFSGLFSDKAEIFNGYGSSEAPFVQGIKLLKKDDWNASLWIPRTENTISIRDENGAVVKDG